MHAEICCRPRSLTSDMNIVFDVTDGADENFTFTQLYILQANPSSEAGRNKYKDRYFVANVETDWVRSVCD